MPRYLLDIQQLPNVLLAPVFPPLDILGVVVVVHLFCPLPLLSLDCLSYRSGSSSGFQLPGDDTTVSPPRDMALSFCQQSSNPARRGELGTGPHPFTPHQPPSTFFFSLSFLFFKTFWLEPTPNPYLPLPHPPAVPPTLPPPQ